MLYMATRPSGHKRATLKTLKEPLGKGKDRLRSMAMKSQKPQLGTCRPVGRIHIVHIQRYHSEEARRHKLLIAGRADEDMESHTVGSSTLGKTSPPVEEEGSTTKL